MKKPIRCSESYNPYKYLDKLLYVFMDYAFKCVASEDDFNNAYTHTFNSGALIFKIRNNPFYDNCFNVDIEHVKYGILYLRGNIELDSDVKNNNLIDIIKNILHKYCDDLGDAQRRAVMIASIID